MTIKIKKCKDDGIWNVIDGVSFLPCCQFCGVIACNFRNELLTGCDGFKRPKEAQQHDTSNVLEEMK